MPDLSSLTPADLNLPSKFREFRRNQIEAAEFVLENDRPITALCKPTGSGKSLLPPLIQHATGEKLVVLTALRTLQDQYMDEQACIGMADVRGMSNYQCKEPPAKGMKYYSCERGSDEGCPLAGSRFCTYQGKVAAFQAADLGVTNYQFWMHSRRNNPSALGDVKTLVMDEADVAMEELERFLQVRFSWGECSEWNQDVPQFSGREAKGGPKLGKWREWAKVAKKSLRAYVSSGVEHDKAELKRLKETEQQLWWVANMQDGDWVWEPDNHGVSFDCVWPAKYAKGALWGGIERVVLLSATVRPYTMQLLGIPKLEARFKEWPRVFPINRMPFIHIPTVRVGNRMSHEEMETLIAQCDRLIEDRLHWKGLIHTKSYDRARYIYQYSRYAKHMLLNDSRTTRDIAERFRKSKAPCILVSPSYPRGWDFPDDQLRYQIIAKVPFNYTISQLAKARKKDKRYELYSVMQDLVQMRGRGMRHEKDYCETFILDGHVQWVEPAARGYAPLWWSMRRMDDPPPPMKL